MDKSGDHKRLLTKQISVSTHEEDRLSNLPESLLCRIMLNLRTKDVVQSCVLSKRWRNLWRYVPALDVESSDFRHYNAFVSFVYMFLALNRESCFHSARLGYDSLKDKRHMVHVKNWINILSDRKVKEVVIVDYSYDDVDVPKPLAVYTCKSLLSLELEGILLVNPKLITFPFLKVIKLNSVKVANALALEKLISSCPVLKSLCITDPEGYIYDKYRVCSQSLLRFEHIGTCTGHWEQLEVEIDAPKLEYMRLIHLTLRSLRIKNLESLIEADIDIAFNFDLDDQLQINMSRDFLLKISGVKLLSISSYMTLSILDDLRLGLCQLLYHNLSYLQVEFEGCSLKMLSSFLEIFPNLKSFVLGFLKFFDDDGVLSMPQCLLTSLEYVKIEGLITGHTSGMELVRYFLNNSAILKKLTLRVAFAGDEKIEDCVVLKELLTIKRLSTSCQVVVL